MNASKHYYEDEGYNQSNYYNNNEEDYNEIPSKAVSHKRENDIQPSFLRRNIIYIIMFLMLIAAFVLNNYDVAKFLKDNLDIDVSKYDFFKKPETLTPQNNKNNNTTTITDSTNSTSNLELTHDWLLDFKKDYIYPHYWELLFTFILISILIFYILGHHLQEDQNINIKNEEEMEDQIRSDPYLIRQSSYQYEQLREYHTKRELDKLYNSEQFRRMRQDKGDNITNWNWQLKEKEMKDVYREKGTESEDISHLSLSD